MLFSIRVKNEEGEYVYPPPSISPTQIANWDTAYGWGNHAQAGYASDSALQGHVGDSSIHFTQAQIGIGAGQVISGTLHIDRIPTIPNSKLANISQNQVLGRTVAGTGPVSAISGTISGRMLGSDLLALSAGAGLEYTDIGSYNGSATKTIRITEDGVTNAMILNSSLSVTTGTGLTGGGPIDLGGTRQISFDESYGDGRYGRLGEDVNFNNIASNSNTVGLSTERKWVSKYLGSPDHGSPQIIILGRTTGQINISGRIIGDPGSSDHRDRLIIDLTTGVGDNRKLFNVSFRNSLDEHGNFEIITFDWDGERWWGVEISGSSANYYPTQYYFEGYIYSSNSDVSVLPNVINTSSVSNITIEGLSSATHSSVSTHLTHNNLFKGNVSSVGGYRIGSTTVIDSNRNALFADGTFEGEVNAESVDISSNGSYLKDGNNVITIATKGDTTSYTSTIAGRGAGDNVTDGSTSRQSTFGYAAGHQNAGEYQSAFGYDAGRNNTGDRQSAFGYWAGRDNTRDRQSAFGYWAGRNNTGDRQSAFGYDAGLNNTGDNQSAFGYFAGRENTGVNQSAFGWAAGFQNTGDHQAAFGLSAGERNTGDRQSAFGYFAGRENTGVNQSAFGNQAGQDNTGTNQSAFGYRAGRDNTGDNGVFIGYEAGRGNELHNKFIVEQRNVNATPLIQGDFSTGNVSIVSLDVVGLATFKADVQVDGTLRIGTNEFLRANPAQTRFEVFDAIGEKAAMGYLDSLPKNDSSGNWGSNDYGFWVKPGDNMIIDGDVIYENGDWLIENDATIMIVDGITENRIIALGTDSGNKGLFLYDADENIITQLTASGLRAFEDFQIGGAGTGDDFWEFGEGFQFGGTDGILTDNGRIKIRSDVDVEGANISVTSLPRVSDEGLVGLWRFDGSLINAVDGGVASPTGTPEYTQAVSDKGALFGNGFRNCEIASPELLDGNVFIISFWAELDGSGGAPNGVFFQEGSGYASGIEFNTSDNQLHFWANSSESPSRWRISEDIYGRNHWMLVWDYVNNSGRMYRNGALVGTRSLTVSRASSITYARIGESYGNRVYNGMLDEVRTYALDSISDDRADSLAKSLYLHPSGNSGGLISTENLVVTSDALINNLLADSATISNTLTIGEGGSGGEIVSSNYSDTEGSEAGYKLLPNEAIFNDVTIRGTLDGTDGSFTGDLTGEDMTLSGTLSIETLHDDKIKLGELTGVETFPHEHGIQIDSNNKWSIITQDADPSVPRKLNFQVGGADGITLNTNLDTPGTVNIGSNVTFAGTLIAASGTFEGDLTGGDMNLNGDLRLNTGAIRAYGTGGAPRKSLNFDRDSIRGSFLASTSGLTIGDIILNRTFIRTPTGFDTNFMRLEFERMDNDQNPDGNPQNVWTLDNNGKMVFYELDSNNLTQESIIIDPAIGGAEIQLLNGGSIINEFGSFKTTINEAKILIENTAGDLSKTDIQRDGVRLYSDNTLKGELWIDDTMGFGALRLFDGPGTQETFISGDGIITDGNIETSGDLEVNGDAQIDGDLEVKGNALVNALKLETISLADVTTYEEEGIMVILDDPGISTDLRIYSGGSWRVIHSW